MIGHLVDAETKQLQESTLPQLVDRLAAIMEGAGFNGCLKQPALRELHNIETEIRRRAMRLQIERITEVNAEISAEDRPCRRISDSESRYGSRWNESQQ
jgi:hypothetical protein